MRCSSFSSSRCRCFILFHLLSDWDLVLQIHSLPRLRESLSCFVCRAGILLPEHCCSPYRLRPACCPRHGSRRLDFGRTVRGMVSKTQTTYLVPCSRCLVMQEECQDRKSTRLN